MGLQSTLPHKSFHATGGVDAIAPSDIGAATAAQGAKADTASQFQPNPDNVSDADSGIQVSNAAINELNGYYKIEGRRTENGVSVPWWYRHSEYENLLLTYDRGNTNLWQSFDEYTGENSIVASNVTTFPWDAEWPDGITVEKAPNPRLVGTALDGSNGQEGTSVYAARADHVHPFPAHTHKPDAIVDWPTVGPAETALQWTPTDAVDVAERANNAYHSSQSLLQAINGLTPEFIGAAPLIDGRVPGENLPPDYGHLVLNEFVAPYNYIGRAATGTSISSATWKISRIQIGNDGSTTTLNAAGAWANRASLSYS